MISKVLRIGVVGAGVFGNYHAAKCAAHPRHEFIGIFDPDHDRVRKAAKAHDTRAFDNLNTLISGVEALIAASPAMHHGPIAAAALRAGRHVLVEKPLANTLETAQTMLDLATDQNLILQVGHQERFVARAIGLDRAPERPVSIRAKRFSPRNARNTDVSVTLDLMTHDLDMAMFLMGAKPSRIKGESHKVYSDNPDAALADLQFPGGGSAHLEASRAEDGFTRITEISYPSGKLIIDFVAKTFVNETGFDFDADFGKNPIAADSLGAATDAFTASILDGTPIAVPGQAGFNSVEAALKIDGVL